MEQKSFGEVLVEFFKKYAMVIVLFLVLIFFTWKTGGKIVQPNNITNIIAQNAYVFVLATGMLLCILTGGNIDLSVGSVVCFVGAVGAVLTQNHQWNVFPVVIIMILLGILIGATQAFWIAYVRIPPFIVTLAGMFIYRGLSNIVLDGKTVSISPKLMPDAANPQIMVPASAHDVQLTRFLNVFGGGADCYLPDIIMNKIFKVNVLIAPGKPINITCIVIGVLCVGIFVAMQIVNRIKRKAKKYEVENFIGWIVKLVLISAVGIAFTILLSLYKGIPSALIIVGIVVLIYSYITNNTTTGRYFYAVGGNEKATKLSGINTNWTYFLAYMNMGFLAALAGMLTIARMSSAQPTYGQNYEMDAISSCFIGGASAYGGIGTVPGAIVGAVLMGVINLGMNICNVDQNWQKVVKGCVLLAAVIFDVVSKRGFKFISKD